MPRAWGKKEGEVENGLRTVTLPRSGTDFIEMSVGVGPVRDPKPNLNPYPNPYPNPRSNPNPNIHSVRGQDEVTDRAPPVAWSLCPPTSLVEMRTAASWLTSPKTMGSPLDWLIQSRLKYSRGVPGFEGLRMRLS